MQNAVNKKLLSGTLHPFDETIYLLSVVTAYPSKEFPMS